MAADISAALDGPTLPAPPPPPPQRMASSKQLRIERWVAAVHAPPPSDCGNGNEPSAENCFSEGTATPEPTTPATSTSPALFNLSFRENNAAESELGSSSSDPRRNSSYFGTSRAGGGGGGAGRSLVSLGTLRDYLSNIGVATPTADDGLLARKQSLQQPHSPRVLASASPRAAAGANNRNRINKVFSNIMDDVESFHSE
eukprot:PhM_4_TR13640/c0_g1_i2/m.67554